MFRTIASIILSFLGQPVLWIGLFIGYLISSKRVKKEREVFHVAINPRHLEWRHFWVDGLLLGLFFSFLTLFIGIVLPPYFIIIYEVIAILFLAASFLLINPTIVLSVVTVLVLLYGSLSATFLDPVLKFLNMSTSNDHARYLGACLLFLVGIVSALTGYFMIQRGAEVQSPRLSKSSRGRYQAYYPLRQLAMAPVFFLIPGDLFSSNFNFWPTFAIGQNRYSLFILPIFIGFFIKVTKEVPEFAAQKAARWYFISALVYFLLGIIGLFVYQFSLILALVAFFVSLGFDVAIANSGNSGGVKYVDVKNGIRVLGVMPETPAETMALEPGDIILTCNDIPVTDELSFYEAVQSNLTYCHLKVRNAEGEIKICETAIYSDSPHKLGVVMFPESDEIFLEDELDGVVDEDDETNDYVPEKLTSREEAAEQYDDDEFDYEPTSDNYDYEDNREYDDYDDDDYEDEAAYDDEDDYDDYEEDDDSEIYEAPKPKKRFFGRRKVRE